MTIILFFSLAFLRKAKMIDKISQYLEKFDFDVRKTRGARFMDQKVTPDVLSFIAECILNLPSSKISFTVKDIWDSEYFEKNTKAIFSKPSPRNTSAKHEYDKFIQQPLKMLAFANILAAKKDGNVNLYQVVEKDILEYISIKERNAFIFLSQYLVKVLVDSGMIRYFETFKNNQTKENFRLLKQKFIRFIKGNTLINTDVEIRRIFPKVLNIYSVYHNIKGTRSGRLSKSNFTFSDLMYNNVNFRDIGKDKNLTRQEAKSYVKAVKKQQKEYNKYLIEKARRIIQKKYQFSEVKDVYGKGGAIHVHHIFSSSGFPQIAHFLENLIKLTADQHLYHAHSKGNTQVINRDYQCVCLIAKSDSIEKSLGSGEFLYSKNDFIYVVNTGLKASLGQNLDFNQIRLQINKIYNAN